MVRNIHYFHVQYEGTILKELDWIEYQKLLRDERLPLGWIDEHTFFMTKPIVLTKQMLLRILKLGGWIQ